uniref:Chromosome 2 open reading frame 80 n=1 Tax=Nothoprocta perdicaria TaxID=30464 RepID=A0A8C6ZCG1_NOTPE
MERRCLKREIEKLLSDYIGIRLRENEFDPRGQRQSTFLDDMAHYNLALSVALLWLNDSDAQPLLTKEAIPALFAFSRYMYPNRTEREAMILSSYAGILMVREQDQNLFKIVLTCAFLSFQNHWIHPFNLSLHPFAMLAAPRAAEHAWKQSEHIPPQQPAEPGQGTQGSSCLSQPCHRITAHRALAATCKKDHVNPSVPIPGMGISPLHPRNTI